jgi:hypothetical protein
MNYKDALNVSINDKLTKAKLIEIANRLQDQCLVHEISQPEIIPVSNYIKDIQSRMDIHHYEMVQLNKDVRNVWTYVKDKVSTLSIT